MVEKFSYINSNLKQNKLHCLQHIEVKNEEHMLFYAPEFSMQFLPLPAGNIIGMLYRDKWRK